MELFIQTLFVVLGISLSVYIVALVKDVFFDSRELKKLRQEHLQAMDEYKNVCDDSYENGADKYGQAN